MKLYGFKWWEYIFWNISWRVFQSSGEIRDDIKSYTKFIDNLIWKSITIPSWRLREWIAERRDSRR